MGVWEGHSENLLIFNEVRIDSSIVTLYPECPLCRSNCASDLVSLYIMRSLDYDIFLLVQHVIYCAVIFISDRFQYNQPWSRPCSLDTAVYSPS